MTAVIRGNNRQTRDATVPPLTLKDDGTTYKYRMFYDDNRKIAEADTVAELIEVLIPDYLTEDRESAKLYHRVTYAKQVQSSTRAVVLSQVDRETWDGLDDTEKALLQWSGDEDPDADFGEDNLGIWSSSVPLVLLDINYKPYSDKVPPLSSEGDHPEVSNIIWIRSVDEEAFLETLHKLGIIYFGLAHGLRRIPAKARKNS